jgi:hypothetical protein
MVWFLLATLATFAVPTSSTTVGVPGWYPSAWQSRIDQAQLLVSGPQAAGDAHVGNGYVSSFVASNSEYVAGVFNGALSYELHTTSHRVMLPSLVAGLKVAGLPVATTALDVENGAFLQVVPVAGGSYCVLRTYAHRALPHLLVTDVFCDNTLGTAPLSVVVVGSETLKSTDLAFAAPQMLNASLCWSEAWLPWLAG